MRRATPDTPLPRLGHCLRVSGICLCLLLQVATARAEVGASPAWYDVEVVVFRHRSLQADGERWSGQGPVQDSEFSSVPLRSELKELPAGQYALDNIASALQRSGDYEVLLHTAWRQPGNDRTTAIPYPMPHKTDGAGNMLGGSIRLVRERFLHLDVDIVASAPQALHFMDVPEATRYPDAPVYRLNEARRVRSGELHYFDHPYLGLIARVVPYTPPELPVPVGTVRVEDSDPRVIADEPAPAAEAAGEPAGAVQ